MIRLAFAVICFLFLSAVPVFAQTADNAVRAPALNGFHLPSTPAEKALNDILNKSFEDDNMIDFILHTPYYDPKKDTGYARYFTPALLKALAAAEVELVRKTCGGRYTGELCDFEYVPTTCSQDWGYVQVLFRTERQSATDATLSYGWPDNAHGVGPAGIYHMIYANKHWMLDGIQCFKTDKFNMK